MPSNKKRINLTVPDNIYEQIQAFKEENGLESDATACLQLVVRQLKAQESTKAMMSMIHKMSIDDLTKISQEGWTAVKDELDKQ